jgi:hypothetical protein
MKGPTVRLCLQIVRDLKALPTASPFVHPVDAVLVPGYYDLIADPQDLTSIEHRLLDHRYRSVAEWKRDMLRIWENAITFSGPRSPWAVSANHLRKIMEKKLKRLSTTNLTGWLSRVGELTEALNSFVSHPPDTVRSYAPIEMLANRGLEPFMPEDYDFLFSALTLLPEEEDRSRLKKLLKKPANDVELTTLPLSLLHKAIAFAKEKMPEQRAVIGIRDVNLA